MKELEEEVKLEKCAICMDDIGLQNLANLDCCCHKFCLECITKWVEEVENTCPLCKQSITKLTTKNADGIDVDKEIRRRRQEDVFD